MPTIDVDYADFESTLGVRMEKDLDRLNDVLALVKGEVKAFDESAGVMSVEIKDTNRPDLWNVEGLARALRGLLGAEKGLRRYSVGKKIVDVHVDRRLKPIRPYIGCSIVKDVKLTDVVIRGLMQLQDKLDLTYGRSRQRASIGLYDFSLIAPPLEYGVAKPNEVSFVPLGFEEKMSLREILKRHPKGVEYGHIVKGHSVYPILLDSKKNVLSFPPVINSNDLGKVTEATRHVLVEVTGTMHETVLNTLALVTLSLIDRGGKAYSAVVDYPDENVKVTTPKLDSWQMNLDVDYANKVLGLELTAKHMVVLLGKTGFGVEKSSNNALSVQVPCHRIDVMHQIDLVEDIAIAYGFNKIEPLWRKLPTTGGVKPEQSLLGTVRELMVGLGFQEVLTYTLTNPENLFTKMNSKKERIVEVANPKVQTLTCLRNWLLPSLMEFLGNNLSVEYPQRIFELGNVIVLDEKEETRTRDEYRLAAVVSHANASFSEIKSALDSLFMNLGLEWQIKETKHPSFIEGRVGTAIVNKVNVGVLGEISPKVLNSWKLENPTTAFELDVGKIIKIPAN